MIFIIKGFRTFVFIFIVISTTNTYNYYTMYPAWQTVVGVGFLRF